MNHYIKPIFLALILLFSSSILASPSGDFESVDGLKDMTKDFLVKNVALESDETMDVQINSSDLPRQLSKCENKIDISLPREASREKINSVEMVCNGEKSWHVYIPVNVQLFTKVVIAKYPISPDTKIAESDLDYSQANVSHLYNGYFKNKNELVGYVASQVINSGTVISKMNIRRPQLIRKNQEIDLIARKNAVQVTMKAIAKTDGSLNDAIIAYNPSSKKTVEAVVVGLNRAEVIS